MKKVYLTGKYGSKIGNYALVDDDVYEEINKYKWFVAYDKYNYYAVRTSNVINNKRKAIYMHRRIWELKNGQIPNHYYIDHIDGNGLDNRIKNLRLVTHQQNHFNQKLGKNWSSKYKGVSWHKQHKKWRASIVISYKRIHLGYFDNEIDAAIAYDKAALIYHKEYANLNFPEKLNEYLKDLNV